MKSSLVWRLAEYASALRYEDLPREVLDRAKVCLLDVLGLACGGYEMEVSRLALRTIGQLGPSGRATVWLEGSKARALDAVVANSVLAHSFLQDDWEPVSHAHVGVAVVPTVFAVAEEGGQSGREVLLATVTGYEIEARVGVLSVPTFSRGFRPTGLYGAFGGAAVAGKLARLSPEQLKNALACAGGMTGGVLQPWIDGSMEWTFQAAFGCRTGILAVLLAQQGFRGADEILEGRCGVNASFAGTLEGQERAVEALGEKFSILDVCFKRVPTGGANQGSAAVALDLAQRHAIDYRRVRAVRVQIPHTGTHERMNYPGITYQGPYHSVDQCLISKPFAIAAILKNRALDIDIVRREQESPEITALAQRVHLEEVKGVSGWSLVMEIELEDGTILRGDGANIDQSHIYLDRERAAEKFLGMASPRLGRQRAEEVVTLVFRLEELDGVAPIVERMALPRAR